MKFNLDSCIALYCISLFVSLHSPRLFVAEQEENCREETFVLNFFRGKNMYTPVLCSPFLSQHFGTMYKDLSFPFAQRCNYKFARGTKYTA